MDIRTLVEMRDAITELNARLSAVEAWIIPEAADEATPMTLPEPMTLPDTPEPSQGWVADLHKEILTMASRPARQGTNAGNPRKNSMTDGTFIYLPLTDDDLARRPIARRHGLNFRDIHRIRKLENAHALITWLRGPNPNPRVGREDANRTQWVRVEIPGPAERRISRAQADEMFTKASA